MDENGEILSIIQAMETKTENFMELLSDRYFYKESIDEYNSELQGEDGVNYKTVKNLYCSPVVKRTIWRAVNIAGGLNHAHYDDPHEEAGVDLSRIPQEGAGGQERGNEGTHYQHGGRIPPGYIIVIGALNFSACRYTHGKEGDKGDNYTCSVNIHLRSSSPRLSEVKPR